MTLAEGALSKARLLSREAAPAPSKGSLVPPAALARWRDPKTVRGGDVRAAQRFSRHLGGRVAPTL